MTLKLLEAYIYAMALGFQQCRHGRTACTETPSAVQQAQSLEPCESRHNSSTSNSSTVNIVNLDNRNAVSNHT